MRPQMNSKAQISPSVQRLLVGTESQLEFSLWLSGLFILLPGEAAKSLFFSISQTMQPLPKSRPKTVLILFSWDARDQKLPEREILRQHSLAHFKCRSNHRSNRQKDANYNASLDLLKKYYKKSSLPPFIAYVIPKGSINPLSPNYFQRKILNVTHVKFRMVQNQR